MGNLIAKIAITGGPCAGKTTALSRIEQELSDRGYRVFVISESATELIKGGIRPFGLNSFELVEFQRLILQYQYQKEEIYLKAVEKLPESEKCVIICDRGLMDNKAYIPNFVFHQLCGDFGVKELDIMDSYSMVIHLVTAADGCPEYYTLENNEARSESIEEAIKLDQNTQNVWSGHNRFVVIDNSVDFNEKMNKVIENICQLVCSPFSIRYQKKYLVDLSKSSLSFLQQDGVVKIDFEQTYLYEKRKNYEKRLRKRTLDNETTFYLTVQKKSIDGLSKIITDQKITEKQYYKLLDLEKCGTVKKQRYTFVYQKQYFKLDIFDNDEAILELNPISKEGKIIFPKNLYIDREITNDVNYDNFNIACNKKKYIKK